MIKLPSWVYVKWDTICTPKENGGLGFRHLSTWNKAAIGKMVWHIGNQKDELWVKWGTPFTLKMVASGVSKIL